MSGGDVRVLRQEAGQESPRMPAWKREILERRKAKGGGSGAGAAEAYPSGSAQRVNGEVTGNSSGLKKDNGTGEGSNRSYTITTASKHFASKRGNIASPDLSPMKTNKDPWSATDPHDTLGNIGREDDGHESLVLQDSLGPLQENPFIKLEKERKKQQDATRPVQHILELYGSVPGIRTIRAENIIIIESDPGYFPEAGSKSQQNGVSSYSSLNDLLDRRGSAITEIRAKEVVIYDTTLSKSEENLSTLGRPDHEDLSYEAGGGRGRVSRILQKFDSKYGKLQKKSHSTENLLDLESSCSRPRLRPKPQPVLVPKPAWQSQPPGSPVRKLDKQTQSVFQTFPSSSSSRPKPQPADTDGGAGWLVRSAETPQSVSSVYQLYEGRGGRSGSIAAEEPDAGLQVGPSPAEIDWEGADLSPLKAKVPFSFETAASYKKTSNFEIRPSPKPDLSKIPDGDTQARALANLRLQSRNSFTVIPKRNTAATAASPPSKLSPALPRVPTPQPPSPTRRPGSKARAGKPLSEKEVARAGGRSSSTATTTKSPKPAVPTSPVTPVTPEPSSAAPSLTPAPSTPPVASPHLPANPPASPAATSIAPSAPDSPSPVPEEQIPADQLPVTNIDDIEVEHPQAALDPAPSPAGQRRTGKTFTVVPKRKVESELQPSSPEPPQQQEASGGAQAGSTSPLQTPYTLGSMLKKRYPAVEEIQVVGGYLSLGRSCLTKTGSVGKKLKISFNESSLQSTFEYPSEGSVWDSEEDDDDDDDGEEEEEEEEGGKPEGKVSDDQPSMVGRIHIPRPSFTTSPANSSDLSNYVPKHSVDFTAWQEHKLDDPVYQGDNSYQQTPMSEQVMLTPATSSSLSDFNSEPALYF